MSDREQAGSRLYLPFMAGLHDTLSVDARVGREI